MKKIVMGAVVSLATLTLAACGNQAKSSSSNSSSSVSSQAVATKNSSSTSSAASVSSSSSSETNVDNRTAGVMVALLANPDWFKDGVSHGGMYYGTNAANYDLGSEVAGYAFLTGNGDPTSYLYYKVDGDTVTYKQWVPSDEGVATGHMETKTAKLSHLEKDYYVTQDQKDEVNGYVNQLKNESDYASSLKKTENDD